jgi:N-acyl amino acid synthase of PEP-CTERM/exosortase system
MEQQGSNFEQYFEIVPALSPALVDEAFKIRHQVYCEDLAFEPLSTNGRESDQYDAQSLHLLVRSVKTGDFVGCTRLIRARAGDAQPLMPFERVCADSLDRTIVDPARLPRDSIGEISRLSVVAAYRKRKGEQQKPAPLTDRDFGTEGRPRFPYILVGLYLGVIELARRHGIETLFVLTEPRLATHLRRIGVDIEAIGAETEHHGMRVPSMMRTSSILDNLKARAQPLYLSIAKEIDAAFARGPRSQ